MKEPQLSKTAHAKMPISERAKQFMPFKAVSGLDEALERKEAEHFACTKITTECIMEDE